MIICPTDHPIEWLIWINRPSSVPRINLSDVAIQTDCPIYWDHMVHTDSQINYVVGTTSRTNVQLIRITTIPRSSIDLNRFNQIDVSRKVSLAEANLFRSDGRIYFWRSYRSDRSRIFERMIQQIDTMCFLSIIDHIRLTELLDRVIHQIGLFIHCSFIFL